jgi:hypothetical protein
MLKARHVVASFSFIILFPLWFATAQEKPAETDLKLVTIGNGKTTSGVRTAFRVYESPEGAQGQVLYVKFDSLQAAQQQIEEWVKATPSIAGREQNQIKGRIVISDRILGVTGLPKSDKKEFVIIRRDDLVCYVIEAVSLPVATEIEDLIQHK